MNTQYNFEIEQERIVDSSSLTEDYFCSICQCLFWKPRSCAECQHIFCQQCIRKWQETSSRCPFRCEIYQDQRCPPLILSLLSRLKIRCRYESVGCNQILLYDRLEQHEQFECQFRLSQRNEIDLGEYLKTSVKVLRRKNIPEQLKTFLINQLRSATLIQLFFFYLFLYITSIMIWNQIPTRFIFFFTSLSFFFSHFQTKQKSNESHWISIVSSIVASAKNTLTGISGIYIWINWMPYYLVFIVLVSLSVFTRYRLR